MEKPMDCADFQRVEQDLQQQLHPLPTLHTKGLQYTQGWSTASLGKPVYMVLIVQGHQSSQYVVPCGGIFLGKWRSFFVGSSGGKMNVQLACALNIQYTGCGISHLTAAHFVGGHILGN
jgi:hypothetical protein